MCIHNACIDSSFTVTDALNTIQIYCEHFVLYIFCISLISSWLFSVINYFTHTIFRQSVGMIMYVIIIYNLYI